MNLIIEVIAGVPYGVEKADSCVGTCEKCIFSVRSCNAWCVRGHDITHAYYRHLTAEEREKLQAALDARRTMTEGEAK